MIPSRPTWRSSVSPVVGASTSAYRVSTRPGSVPASSASVVRPSSVFPESDRSAAPVGESCTVRLCKAGYNRTVDTVRDRYLRILAEHGIRATYPDSVRNEVDRLLRQPGIDDPALLDLTGVPFVTIDNVGSRDLDQAVFVDRVGDDGYRVDYALADAARRWTACCWNNVSARNSRKLWIRSRCFGERCSV